MRTKIISILFSLVIGANAQKVIAFYKHSNNLSDAVGSYNLTGSTVTYGLGSFDTYYGWYPLSNNAYAYGDITTGLSGNFTFGCWVYFTTLPTTAGGERMLMCSNVSSYNNYYIALHVYNSGTGPRLYIHKYNGAQNPGAISPTDAVTGKWYWVVGVKNGSILQLYVNGVFVASATDNTTSTPTYSKFTLGRQYYGDARQHDGAIDDAFIMDGPMSPAQVKNMWAKYKGFF